MSVERERDMAEAPRLAEILECKNGFIQKAFLLTNG
jgi:hypothetical protein